MTDYLRDAAAEAAEELRRKTRLRPLMLKPEVLEATGRSYPTIWSWMRQGLFPLSVTMPGTRVAWYRDEVAAWLESRPRSKLKPIERDETND